MTKPEASAGVDRDWERGFSDHSKKQRLRLAQLPFQEKLKWLEEMHRLLAWISKNPLPFDS